MAFKIVWNKKAVENIAKALEWISQESAIEAERVEHAIITKVEELAEMPGKYPLDKFKNENNGNYRAFETHSYRISYRHTATTVRILRIRHVKQRPIGH
jgi:plasmid stabilization system protein ParE